ncbi:MAG: hypothetical protein P8171_21825 [Candidatus Thiodiazotropha sp.]
MTTALVIHRDEFDRGATCHRFSLHDDIYTQEINVMGKEIEHILANKLFTRGKIVFDLTKADEVLYKPTRLFGLCQHFSKRITSSGIEVVLQVLLRKEHVASLQGSEEALFEIIQCDPEYNELDQGINEQPNDPVLRVDITSDLRIPKIVCGVVACISTLGIIGSIVLLEDLVGLAGFVSSGVLLFESLYVGYGLTNKARKMDI